MKNKALWNYNAFILKNIELNDIEEDNNNNNHHAEDLCERCIELGRYCK